MAKRTRASRSAYRPGGQGPSRAKDGDSATPAAPTGGIDSAIDSVTIPDEVESAEISVAAPVAASARQKGGRRSARTRSDGLEARAAAEEAWVKDDLRTISVITLFLVIGLAIAWVLFVPMNIAGLY